MNQPLDYILRWDKIVPLDLDLKRTTDELTIAWVNGTKHTLNISKLARAQGLSPTSPCIQHLMITYRMQTGHEVIIS